MAEPVSTPPAPVRLRAELQDLIINDLLGPAGGENEVLADARERVSARYLVGMLAPRGTVATEPGRQDGVALQDDDEGDRYVTTYVEAEGLQDPVTIRGRLKAVKAVIGNEPAKALEKVKPI
ncbi:MAG TPA: hypothetical protein VGK32_21610 [Vicinamibacterales bacterium]|jgi:hypothetical protein